MNDYQLFPDYIEKMRKGKHIPLSYLADLSISDKTYRRFTRGETDIRVRDLIEMIDLLALSPYEVTEMLMSTNSTVRYRVQYMFKIDQADFEGAHQIYKSFQDYMKQTGFTLGKEEVNIQMMIMDYKYNPNSYFTQDQVEIVGRQMLKRLEEQEVFSIYNLEFLSLYASVVPVSYKLIRRIVLNTSKDEIIDLRTRDIVERFLLNMLVHSLKYGSRSDIASMCDNIIDYNAEKNLYMQLVQKLIVRIVPVISDKQPINYLQEEFSNLVKGLENFASEPLKNQFDNEMGSVIGALVQRMNQE